MKLRIDRDAHAAPPMLKTCDEAFPVGLGGQAYVTGLAAENRLHVSWPRGRCSLDLAYVQNADPLPDLGTRVCRRDAP